MRVILLKCLAMLFKKQDKLAQFIKRRELSASPYKIIAQEFDEHSHETRFKIHQQGSNKLIILTAKHFALNKKLLQQLTHEDAYLIGFTFAQELVAREKQCILTLKVADRKL